MADSFRPVFEALKEATVALIEASEANARAGHGLKKAADAVLAARDGREDLRETVARLESLVVVQRLDLRALRERLDSGEL